MLVDMRDELRVERMVERMVWKMVGTKAYYLVVGMVAALVVL